MSKRKISNNIRQQVRTRAQDRCEYCRDFRQFAASSFHVDHIVAEQHSGTTTLGNLAFACGPCNLFKGPNLVTTLPGLQDYVNLFNPRKDVWTEHFSTDKSGIIEGITLEGKATAKLLRFNTVENVAARKRLIELKLF